MTPGGREEVLMIRVVAAAGGSSIPCSASSESADWAETAPPNDSIKLGISSSGASLKIPRVFSVSLVSIIRKLTMASSPGPRTKVAFSMAALTIFGFVILGLTILGLTILGLTTFNRTSW
ncbi:hypothetical protein ES703_13231 [subsurface metagenome]